MELSPIEIHNKIKDTPLYQQEDLFKHYEGMDIKGIGSLCSIDLDSFNSVVFKENKFENGVYVHMLTYNKETDSFWYPTIWCYADLNVYPELKFKKKHQKILFTGKLKKVQANDIYVVNPKFTFESEYPDLIADEEPEKEDVEAKPLVSRVVKTIKNKLKTEGLFIESRSQNEDLHLLIGKRDGTADKAHIVIDGKTAEIRVEDNQQEPTDLIEKVESILTLRGGKRVKVTREAIEELPSSLVINDKTVADVDISIFEIQKQKFKANKKNYLDPRNSNK